jgi:hypothetical protein
MGGSEQEGAGGEEDRIGQAEVAGEEARQQGDGERHGGGGERHHAGPAGRRMGAGIKDLRQPLLGDPRAPGKGEGERVGGGEGAVLDHPAADDDVPVAVGVVEQAVAGDEHDEIEDAADGERCERRRGAADGRRSRQRPAHVRPRLLGQGSHPSAPMGHFPRESAGSGIRKG